jgi:GDP-D-mannose 3',5'-epimerase
MKLSGSNILITGGYGFIGANLVNRLSQLSDTRIRLVDNMDREQQYSIANNNANVETIIGDLRDPNLCNEVCKGIDIIFHLASKAGSMEYYKKNAFEVFSHNVMIDNLLISAAIENKVNFFGYVSSAFVYPIELMSQIDSPPILESQDLPANPAISYGWAKFMGERSLQYALKNNQKMKGAIYRLANVYGPGQSIDLDRGSIIPVLIRRALEYPKLAPYKIYGEGIETRSYCHINDVLEAICISVDIKDSDQLIGPVNIGGEHRISMKDLANLIIEISGKEIILSHQEALPPTTLSQSLNCNKAQDLLNGWSPKISLKSGLQSMYNYIEKKIKSEKMTENV